MAIMAQSTFRYLTPFRRWSRVWQRDGRTDRHSRSKFRA